MKKIHIEFSDERLITPSGLVFVGQILGKSSFVKKINRAPISKDYLQKQIKNGDVLLTYIGMLCQGKPQYEATQNGGELRIITTSYMGATDVKAIE